MLNWEILSPEMLARYLLVGAVTVLVFYSETCLATADYSQDDQLLSREKRGSNKTKTVHCPLGRLVTCRDCLVLCWHGHHSRGPHGCLEHHGPPKTEEESWTIWGASRLQNRGQTEVNVSFLYYEHFNNILVFTLFNQDLYPTAFQYPVWIPFLINSIFYLFRV